MLVGLAQCLGTAFAKAVYRAEFVQDEPIADPVTLVPLIQQSGGDPQPVLTEALQTPPNRGFAP